MRLHEYPSARAHRPLPGSRPQRRSPLRLALRVVGILLLLIVIALGAVAAIVASGPLELAAVRDRVVDAIEAQLGPDYQVKVARATMDVDPMLGLVIAIDEITVRDGGNAVVGRVPATRLAIDPLSLLKLRFDIRTVEMTDAEISVVRGKTGRMFLGTADTPDPSAPAEKVTTAATEARYPTVVSVLNVIDSALEPALRAARANGFEKLALDGATIELWDAARLQQRTFPHSDLLIGIDPASGDLKATFNTSGFSGRWGLTAERSVDPVSGDRSLSAVFSQLSLADIDPNFGKPDSPVSSDIPFYGRITSRLSAAGELKEAAVRLDLGAGNIVAGLNKDNALLDEATIRMHWDPAGRAMIIDPSSVFFGDTRGGFTGRIAEIGDEADGRYSFALESKGAVLAPRDSPEPPVVADRIALSGTVDLAAQRIDVSDAVIATQSGTIAAAGSLGLDGSTPSLALSASATPMPIATIKQMWPPFLAGGTRKWVLPHVKGGMVSAFQYEAAVPGGVLWTGERRPVPEEAMRLDVRLDDVTFTTFGGLPAITKASGNAVLSGSTFGLDVEKGDIVVPSGKVVRLAAGAFAVSDTSPRFPDGRIELQLEGDIGALAEIADSEPIFALQRKSIAATALSGKGQASISLKLPLRPTITQGDVDWRVALNATGFASSEPLDGRTIKDGALTLTATPQEVTINGKATIDGVAASVSMSEPLVDDDGDGDVDSGRRQVRLNLDAAARKRLGIGLDDLLGGTVGAKVSDLDDGRKGQHYELDLKQARLVLGAVGWSKGIGVPAKLSFDLVQREGGYLIDNMVAQGDGFGLKGKALLDGKFGLVSADIERFALRKGDQLSFKLTRKGSGYAITAKGDAFDARGLIARYKAAGAGSDSAAPDITVDAKIGNLIGFNDTALSEASLSVVAKNGTVRKVAIDGMIESGALSVLYEDGGEAADLRVASSNAGSLFRLVDLYTRMAGGQLTLTGRRSGPSGPFSGVFDVVSFAIVGEPSMQRLVSAGSGAPGAAQAKINAQNVPFQRMRLAYTKRGPALVIDEAVLRGATVGATFSGTLDLARQIVSLGGTYLPAYGFNNLFGRVPILGLALGGGPKGGLVGVTFKIEGPMDRPQVMINPLSVMAPGMFRKIFEFPVN